MQVLPYSAQRDSPAEYFHCKTHCVHVTRFGNFTLRTYVVCHSPFWMTKRRVPFVFRILNRRLSKHFCVTGVLGSLLGQSRNSNHPPWLAVSFIFTSIPLLRMYFLTISPVAYLPPASFSRGPCHGSPQGPHLPPFFNHWFCKINALPWWLAQYEWWRHHWNL